MHRLLAFCVLLATATGYKYYAATGSAYKFHKSFMSWYDANATCAGEGAHLTVLNDKVEADTVSSFVKDSVGDYWIWIGLHDNQPGGVTEWRAVTGEPLSDLYHEWHEGHPRVNGGTCVNYGARSKGLYNDWTCDVESYFTCERAQ